VAVDDARSLYRIDLRGLDWRRAIELRGTRFPDVWEAIAARSAYSVEFTGSDAELAKSATGTSFPLPFADHLLDQALGSELYYAVLGFTRESSLSNFLVNVLVSTPPRTSRADSCGVPAQPARGSRRAIA
jgi:hypothetical protein